MQCLRIPPLREQRRFPNLCFFQMRILDVAEAADVLGNAGDLHCQRQPPVIQTIEQRQGLKVACPEEIAFNKGWLTQEQVLALAEPLKKTGYGQYLIELIQRGR